MFTLSFATKKTINVPDYLGIVPGYDEDKIAKNNLNFVHDSKINVPIFIEYPLALESKLLELNFNKGYMIGQVVNLNIVDNFQINNKRINVGKIH